MNTIEQFVLEEYKNNSKSALFLGTKDKNFKILSNKSYIGFIKERDFRFNKTYDLPICMGNEDDLKRLIKSFLDTRIIAEIDTFAFASICYWGNYANRQDIEFVYNRLISEENNPNDLLCYKAKLYMTGFNKIPTIDVPQHSFYADLTYEQKQAKQEHGNALNYILLNKKYLYGVIDIKVNSNNINNLQLQVLYDVDFNKDCAYHIFYN